MDIYYTGRGKKSADIEAQYDAQYLEFDELIRTCDVVSVHTAYNENTRHLFTKETFEAMKEESFFLNLSRGPVVKEADLAAALQAGDIAGAAIDVYEFEPKITEELKGLDNVVITPHIGNATVEARNEMAKLSVTNILRVLEHERALTPVY
jgi:lactate dehydrogenase-like 2-hydroxyacid dehydrogenase